MQKNKKHNEYFIGVDKYTKKHIYLNDKDMLLNTLIVGPTGCGKAHFTLKPLVIEDFLHKDKITIFLDSIGDLASDINKSLTPKNVDYIYIDAFECINSFNPLYGDISDTINNLTYLLKTYHKEYNSPLYFLDKNIELLEKSITVLKTIKGNDVTFNDLYSLIYSKQQGIEMLNNFQKLCIEDEGTLEWFIDYYDSDIKHSETIVFRNIVHSFIKNQKLRLLNNPANSTFNINIEKAIDEGKSIIVNGADSILGRDSWIFNILILQTIYTILEKRTNTEKRVSLYIDEYYFHDNRIRNLLSISKDLNISITANIESTISARIDLCNKDNFINNFILYPGLNMKEASILSKMLLKNFEHSGISKELKLELEPEKLVFRNFGEFCFYQKNSNTPAIIQKIE